MTHTPHAATSAPIPLARPHGKAVRFVVESSKPLTRRQVEIQLMLGDAYRPALLPYGSSQSSLSRRIRAAIAIAFPLGVAAWAILYFAAQLVRGWLA